MRVQQSTTLGGLSPEPEHNGILILDFQPLEINFGCLLPSQSIVLCYRSLNEDGGNHAKLLI